MYRYKVGSIVVGSSVQLPLPEHPARGEPAVSLTVADGHDLAAGPPSQDGPAHEGLISVARNADGYVLAFAELVAFTVSADLQRVVCYPRPEVSAETVAHLFLDQVVPRLLSQRGEVVLHAGAVAPSPASTVERDGAAVVLLGVSGSGKSTLTASFCRNGFALLADDFLILRRESSRFWAVPSYPGLRLWPDSRAALAWDASITTPMAHYSTKERLLAERDELTFRHQPAPVSTLFLLEPPESRPPPKTIAIKPAGGREAMMALVRSAFLLDPADAVRNRQVFSNLADVAKSLRLYWLIYPREIARLADVRQALLQKLAAPLPPPEA